MLRRIAPLIAISAALITPTAGAGADVVVEGAADHPWAVCRLEGTGDLSPGVTFVPKTIAVTFALDVSCTSSDPTLHAGIVTGEGSGTASCGASVLSGTATAEWDNGKVSEMTWEAVAAARLIHVDGTIVSGTEFVGEHFRIVGTLGAPNPEACASGGVTHVTFTEAGVIA